MTHKTCGNCRESIEVGEQYITYGGLCWCSESCLADYYMAPDSPAGWSNRLITSQDIEEIETGIEHRTLTAEDVRATVD